jgi:hypothetical protein
MQALIAEGFGVPEHIILTARHENFSLRVILLPNGRNPAEGTCIGGQIPFPKKS